MNKNWHNINSSLFGWRLDGDDKRMSDGCYNQDTHLAKVDRVPIMIQGISQCNSGHSTIMLL